MIHLIKCSSKSLRCLSSNPESPLERPSMIIMVRQGGETSTKRGKLTLDDSSSSFFLLIFFVGVFMVTNKSTKQCERLVGRRKNETASDNMLLSNRSHFAPCRFLSMQKMSAKPVLGGPFPSTLCIWSGFKCKERKWNVLLCSCRNRGSKSILPYSFT